jgi:hypothetical protein
MANVSINLALESNYNGGQLWRISSAAVLNGSEIKP